MSQAPKIKNICCLGAGYVGGPTMAIIADKCPHIQVNVVDIDHKKIESWNNADLSKLPVFEPGLEEVIKRCRGKNLKFSIKIQENIALADMIFISVNTPTKKKGIGAGEASDLKWIDSSSRLIAEHAKGHTIVVEKSTLPIKTAQTIKEILEGNEESNNTIIQNKKTFSILSNPEFLAEGSAIDDLVSPDRVLIGGEDPQAINSLIDVYLNWIERNKILTTNLWSSELSKLIANAFLAQRVSSINSVAALCEKTGANIKEVSLAIGTDKRIGSRFLNAGPGFGGSCFKKDILNLVYICNHYGLYDVASYWKKVIEINSWQSKRISELITRKLFGTITGKKIAILGFAFKANTNDTRESPAISICNDLLEEGAVLQIYDPKVDANQIENDLNLKESEKQKSNQKECTWSMQSSVYEASNGADAILILTEWEEFKNINWQEISNLMRSPCWLFDTRAIANKLDASSSGINVWSIGDGT